MRQSNPISRGGVIDRFALLAREVKHLVSMAANRFIVQVLEVGWDAEPPYYVMEYLENGSLDDLIRDRGTLPVAQAAELFADLALGLNHSHGKGVLHCDLKPANVLLDQDLRPRLADFGQSRMSHEQTPSLGTLFFMAPEQADLNAVPDARWDVYALGAILFCMVCGYPPYRTPQMVNTLDTAASLPDRLKRYREAIYRSSIPKQHYRVRGMDRELATIIDRCLAKNPDERLANVQQVLEALEHRQVARSRRPLMLLGIVGPLLLLSVMGFFSWRGLSLAQTETEEKLEEWSLRSNEFAAKFAARTLETEFAGIFQILGQESNRTAFRDRWTDFLKEAGPDLLGSLAQEHAAESNIDKLRNLPSRVELQSYIESRFERLMSEHGNNPQAMRYSSMFLVDNKGTNIAITINDSMDENPVGKNFAYRTYFTGLHRDLSPSADRSNIRPIPHQFVSPPFISTSTGRHKIAICTPIFDGDDDAAKDVQGLMVLTINLGDFESLTRDSLEDDEPRNAESRFAILIDGNNGQILQHPFLRKLDRNAQQQFTIDEDQFSKLKKDGMIHYRDPVGTSESGKEYEGDWIAALARVDVASKLGDTPTDDDRSPTDLWVLVQEKTSLVTAPVDGLGRKLLREGMIALLSLLTVICALWIFVLRVVRLPDVTNVSNRGRVSGDTGVGSEVTLTVD
ncbi:MAG: serine/threonine protein kinase [Pirellulales bacterium]